jgi:methylenetetrahydrofolate dehydrogenase (NADP+)/methenyltetrahydrofolate cyclohydrolase
MKANIIDGKKIAEEKKKELKQFIANMEKQPCLAVVLVGNNPASQIYVHHKIKAAEAVGIKVCLYEKPETITQEELISFVRELNQNSKINGIIVQLPLPKHISSFDVLEVIHPDKDVDGLTSCNLGKLFVGHPGLVPCTPLACLGLIKRERENLDGLHAVIVGRSCLVGKPLGQILLEENCTVTQAHSRTKDLPSICREADILVVAVGKANLITAEYIKPGAIVIDVGINRMPNGHICGDVDFNSVSKIAGAITPVPGGVGPMTVFMLMQNVVKSTI